MKELSNESIFIPSKDCITSEKEDLEEQLEEDLEEQLEEDSNGSSEYESDESLLLTSDAESEKNNNIRDTLNQVLVDINKNNIQKKEIPAINEVNKFDTHEISKIKEESYEISKIKEESYINMAIDSIYDSNKPIINQPTMVMGIAAIVAYFFKK